MACFISDLDGTVFYWGTNIPLKGALSTLREIIAQGHQVIFVTLRAYSTGEPEMLQKMLGLPKPATVLYKVDSPRIVINDAGAHAINHPRDGDWNYRPEELLPTGLPGT